MSDKCPFCLNTVSMIVENEDETVYKHSHGNCVDHGDGRVSMTWSKDMMLSILRNAELGTHYRKAVRRGVVNEIIDTDALDKAWNGENTDVLPMTRYQQNGYDSRMSENLERS